MTPGRSPRPEAPPRLFTRLLAATLPGDRRGRSILGDLLEEWHGRPPGARRALWYRQECVRLAARYVFVGRRLPAVAPGGVSTPVEKRALGATFLADTVRHALRRIRQAPTASLLTVVALGVGVGAPTVMYSLYVGVTRDLRVPDPEALVHVGRRYSPSLLRWAELGWLEPVLAAAGPDAGGELEMAGIFGEESFDIGDDAGFAERRRGAFVTAGAMAALGVEPTLGRGLRPDDVDGRGSPVVLLSDLLWRNRFGADPDIVGTRIRVSGTVRTVIGVMPEGFAFPDDATLWLPLDPRDPPAHRADRWEMIGRLAPGASVSGVRERLSAITDGLRESGAVPAELRTPLGAQPWRERMLNASSRRTLDVLLLLVSFVLIIACADVAHLFLARALARRRETAVRIALGAGLARIVGEHIVEATLLAGLGGVLGLGLARVGVRAVLVGLRDQLSWWMDVRVDPAVMLFAAGLVAVAALATGVVPALQSAKVRAVTALRDGDRGASAGRDGRRIIGVLVTAEVALSCVLLVVTGLMVRATVLNLRTDGDYETASVLTARYDLPPDRYADAESVGRFHRDVASSLARHAGVAAVGIASHLPGVFSLSSPVDVDGVAAEVDGRPTHVVYASPGFLDAVGVTPIRGRDLDWRDGLGAPSVALVNEAFARERLGGRDPLGARVRLASRSLFDGTERPPGPWLTVVGVVPPLGLDVGRDHDDTGIYVPVAAGTARDVSVLLRVATGADPASLAPAVRAELSRLDPDLALYAVASLEDQMRATHSPEDLFAGLFAVWGGSALLLAGVGLYGLLTFSVARRTRELGIRAALGARPVAILWRGVRAGALQLGVGLGIGLALAAIVAPGLGDVLMGYEPRSPAVYAGVVVVLVLTGVAASLTPARRAIAVDVARVLRAE